MLRRRKRKAWKVWKLGSSSKEDYVEEKKVAKKLPEDAKFKDLDRKRTDVFCLANTMKQQNTNVFDENYVRNDNNEMAVTDNIKTTAWKQHSK